MSLVSQYGALISTVLNLIWFKLQKLSPAELLLFLPSIENEVLPRDQLAAWEKGGPAGSRDVSGGVLQRSQLSSVLWVQGKRLSSPLSREVANERRHVSERGNYYNYSLAASTLFC